MLKKVPRVAAWWGRYCLVAKPSWGLTWLSWLSPNSDLGPTVIQIRGQGSLLGSVLSHHLRVGRWHLAGGYATPSLGCLWRY
jgi:hypothetical protein